ncbi:MAG: DNA starvation/stationary phase protection protein [Ginsengibacter sp.]|jgi:starvation-inducible DNA-binding protein
MATKKVNSKNPTSAKKTSEKKVTKGFPAPSRLAVPTDLKPDEVKAVAECVNPLVADAFALYTKTKNFHWHLSGSHFRDYHLLFDEQAEAVFDSIDILAERVRRIGGTTIRSISHISSLQTISDNNDDFVTPEDMIAELLEDNKHIAHQMRLAIKITEDNRDTPTSNLLQEQLDATERRIWFLFEVSMGGKNEM